MKVNSEEEDLVDKLWSASYAVTAFAAIQALSYFYALGNNDLKPDIIAAKCIIEVAIVICHTAYVAAIVWCQINIFRIAKPTNKSAFRTVYIGIGIGQGLIVLLLGLAAFLLTSPLK